MKALFFLIASLVFCVCCTTESRLLSQQSSPQQQSIDLSKKQSPPPQRPIDLSQIPHLQPKGRVQDKDYNQIEIIDQLIAMQMQAIPFLIDKLTDETEIKHPAADFWYQVMVGDVAFIILTDFFTDSSGTKTTVPGVSWDAMLERKSQDMPAEELLRKFIAQHGRKSLQEKWIKIWNENQNKLDWDEKERCFKLK